MKKLVFLLLLIPGLCISQVATKSDIVSTLNAKIVLLNDSIVKLNQRQVMTKQQFMQIYKYERLLRYYKICKRKPTQWKYYKGWSKRVFEQ